MKNRNLGLVGFGPKLAFMLLALGAGLCSGVTISFSTTGIGGNLLGTQTLPKFDSALGTLTGVTFQLTSLITGTITMQGTLIETQSGLACSTPNGVSTTVGVSGVNSNLNTSININFPGIVVTPANNCLGTSPYSQAVNMGPVAGQGQITAYSGAGTLPFTFTSVGITNPNWVGTLTVQYSFDAATPEPSSAVLLFGGILGIAALRRRRASVK